MSVYTVAKTMLHSSASRTLSPDVNRHARLLTNVQHFNAILRALKSLPHIGLRPAQAHVKAIFSHSLLHGITPPL